MGKNKHFFHRKTKLFYSGKDRGIILVSIQKKKTIFAAIRNRIILVAARRCSTSFEKEMWSFRKLYSSVSEWSTSRFTDKEIEELQGQVMHFFETIGYHTETQHGYIYTNMYDDHGIYSLRKGMIRAANY